MFRRFVIYLNLVSFTLLQSMAFGATEDRFTAYNDFLKDSDMTKREVSLSELQQKFGKDLPEPIRIQMENFISENPGVKVPKLDVRKVKVNGQDQLQITATTPNGNLIFTTSNVDHVAYTVVGQIDGKEVKSDINYEVVLSDHLLVYQERKELNLEKKPIFLSSDEFNKLPAKQKKDYLKKMRELMEAAEAVQYANHSDNAAATKFDAFSLIFENSAFAGEPESCIVAGWTTGEWVPSAHVCRPPKEASAGCAGMWRCNPALYGDESCVPKDQHRNATFNCGNTDGGDKDMRKVIAKATSAASFVDIKGLQAAILTGYQGCGQGKAAAANQDQKKTCNDLQLRIRAINDISCGPALVGKVAECNPKPEPNPPPAAGPLPPPIVPGKSEPPPPDKASKEGDADLCRIISQNPQPNQAWCGTATHVSCNGKDIFYCKDSCKEGYEMSLIGGTPSEAVLCKQADKNAKKDNAGDHPKKEKSWWDQNKSWALPVGVFGLVGGLMYMMYRSQQNYLDQQASYYQNLTNGGTAPSVITSPTTGITAPAPVSRTFVIPGTR